VRLSAVRLSARVPALAAALVLLLPAAAVAAPTISSVAPATGSVLGGQQVTITGSGFQGGCAGGYEVWFGTDLENGYAIAAPSYQVLSDSQIQATVPASFGGPVDVRVHDACGTSPVATGDRFTYTYPAGQCLSGSCQVTIGSTAAGNLGHVALGFLDGFNTDAGVTITPAEAALVDALHPRQWRLGQAGTNEPWGGVLALARQAGALTSLDLTSDWEDWAYANDRPYYQAPYGDLATYYSFIYNDVENRLATGQMPNYFDVWNEPATTGTVNQWLSVYGTAYRAIEAADPGAQVVGPSLASFLITSAGQGDQPGYELSLSDFLNWEMSTGVRMAAISWHEDGTTVPASPLSPGPGLPSGPVPGGYRDYWSPAGIAAHVRAARALIALYPALRSTQVFVNEYGPTYAVNIPGWMVGDFSALESSGADEGMLTCVTGAACSNLLDGLLGWDGTPQMPYWVMRAYAQMSGQRLLATAAGSNLYVLATRPAGASAVQALIGRGDDCWGGQQCPQFQASGAAPVQLTVNVAAPWAATAASVTVEALPDAAVDPVGDNDVPAAPATVTMRLPVRCGIVSVPLAAVGDGDAFYLTVAPAAPGSSTGSLPLPPVAQPCGGARPPAGPPARSPSARGAHGGGRAAHRAHAAHRRSARRRTHRANHHVHRRRRRRRARQL